MGFTACEALLNLGSLTYCYVLALSLQIHDYCLLCSTEELGALQKQETYLGKQSDHTYNGVKAQFRNVFKIIHVFQCCYSHLFIFQS